MRTSKSKFKALQKFCAHDEWLHPCATIKEARAAAEDTVPPEEHDGMLVCSVGVPSYGRVQIDEGGPRFCGPVVFFVAAGDHEEIAEDWGVNPAWVNAVEQFQDGEGWVKL